MIFTTRITLANLAYNMRRLAWLEAAPSPPEAEKPPPRRHPTPRRSTATLTHAADAVLEGSGHRKPSGGEECAHGSFKYQRQYSHTIRPPSLTPATFTP